MSFQPTDFENGYNNARNKDPDWVREYERGYQAAREGYSCKYFAGGPAFSGWMDAVMQMSRKALLPIYYMEDTK